MLEITSQSNNRIKYIRSLLKKKSRQEHRQYTVEGKKSVHDALRARKSVSVIAVSSSFYENEEFEYPKSAELIKVSDDIFVKLCDTETPQGILAVIDMEDFGKNEVSIDKNYIYCDNVTDPGNIGTIIRTADAAGMGGVILSRNCVDLYSPKTVRSSMGSFFNIPVLTDKTYDDLNKYKSMGFSLYAGALSKDSVDYTAADFTKPSIIIVGNEANGVSKEVLEISRKIKIPIMGKAESLNVSVAASILMYELIRQRS